jgi:hypothetical protein
MLGIPQNFKIHVRAYRVGLILEKIDILKRNQGAGADAVEVMQGVVPHPDLHPSEHLPHILRTWELFWLCHSGSL